MFFQAMIFSLLYKSHSSSINTTTGYQIGLLVTIKFLAAMQLRSLCILMVYYFEKVKLLGTEVGKITATVRLTNGSSKAHKE